MGRSRRRHIVNAAILRPEQRDLGERFSDRPVFRPLLRASQQTRRIPMKNRLLALAAAVLFSGTAAVLAQGLSQDNSQSPKSQTKDQIARPDAQPGMGEDQKGSASGGEQVTQPGSKSDQNMRRTQVQGGEQRDQVQGRERGPQGGEMMRGGEMRGGAPHALT